MRHIKLLIISVLCGTLQTWGQDSLQFCLQTGDSCMHQYNTFEALKHYQRAYEMLPNSETKARLADCLYKRANYRETTELLKTVPEDSLSHESFRQLVLGYKKQSDTDSFVYWASRLVEHFPMDGEIVAGLTLGYAQLNQPEKGLTIALNYSLKDRSNILVNRAIADAFFLKRDFTAAGIWYDQLLEVGDSTFNTLYSAGMSQSQTGNLEKAYHYLSLAMPLSGMQHYGCAYRLGVVCVDTERYVEGLSYLNLALELMKPDTTVMKAITLSEAEGHFRLEHYAEAVESWKRHLDYNPSSIATYFNIASTLHSLLNNDSQARQYYSQFLDLARKVENPTFQLKEMIKRAEGMLKVYELRDKQKRK